MIVSQMCIALGATGYWLYLDVAGTPNAVVACVIIFNAAFGYRWVALTRLEEEFMLNARVAGGRFHGFTRLRCVCIWRQIYKRLKTAQIMPLTFRAKGVSISTATNWA